MTRFTGTIDEICLVDVREMAAWIKAIPLDQWPQQNKLFLMPSMVTDLGWHSFGDYAKPIIEGIVPPFWTAFNPMLSTVMPGHSIAPHEDLQAPYWLFRVHVPLITNPGAVTIMDDGEHHMEAGRAYRMNTMATHSVANRGADPRIHFMFDTRE